MHALSLCHDQGLVHGQIRPEHVLADEEGTAKLVGFRAPPTNGKVPLRPLQGYDAPELHANGRTAVFEVLAAADVWAVGLLLASLCLGQPPPELLASSPPALLQNRFSAFGLAAIPKLYDATPPKLRTLLATMLHPAPGARPTSAALANALGAAATPTPPLPTPEAATEVVVVEDRSPPKRVRCGKE